jgi:hypothetical protein
MVWRVLRFVMTLFFFAMPLILLLVVVFLALDRPGVLPAWLHPDLAAGAWLAGGMCLGAALTLSLGASESVLDWEWSPPRALVAIILFGASLDAVLHPAGVLGAAIAASLAILAVTAGFAAYEALRRGDAIGIQSSWGGLGGGLGGWQLSRAAGLALLTLAALAGAVMSLR